MHFLTTSVTSVISENKFSIISKQFFKLMHSYRGDGIWWCCEHVLKRFPNFIEILSLLIFNCLC